MSRLSNIQTRRVLLISLGALVIAAWTGVLMRFGMVYGFPGWAQNFGAIRHAHSHLMYFGWVTLALMAMIWQRLPALTGRPLPRCVRWQMAATAIMALLSFPAFWANGYGLTQIGPARLPLGSMVAAWNGLTWFVFIWLYVRATRGLAMRPAAVQLWDWALVLLLLASGGALGLMVLVFTRADNPFLQQFFLHQFLDLFAVGWFSLALLGVLWSMVEEPLRRLPTFSLALLVTPTFLLGMSPGSLSPLLFWVAALANAGAALLLAAHGVALWHRRDELAPMLAPALAGLGVIMLVAGALLLPGLWDQNAGGQMRVFYLHNFLLLWISTALLGAVEASIAGIRQATLRWINAVWVIGVAGMVAALFGLALAPQLGLRQLPWLHGAAWASLFVATAATALWVLAVVQRGEAGEAASSRAAQVGVNLI